MRDRKNVLGQCLGDEVKNFGKDVMATWSGKEGLIYQWPNCGEITDLNVCYWVSIMSCDSLPYWQ